MGIRNESWAFLTGVGLLSRLNAYSCGKPTSRKRLHFDVEFTLGFLH